jgi:hypothetical protein
MIWMIDGFDKYVFYGHANGVRTESVSMQSKM